MKTLIIGRGEVGSALVKVLEGYAPRIIDKGDVADGPFEIMHVCIPHSTEFAAAITYYQRIYAPRLTVIHSTVPVGTSRKLGAIHSPVIGQHPNLEQGLRTFVKMIGGADASKAADYFRRAGLRVMLFDSQEATELAKLGLTECYRVNIEHTKRMKALAAQYGVNFHEANTLPATIYNEGYAALGQPEYLRPVLQPIDGEIGGHCVMPNKALIER